MNKMRAVLSVILGILLCFTALSGLASAESLPEETKAVSFTLRTQQDLLDLAEHCRSDTWSKGITVVLENDISLAGIAFEPIRFFAGTLEGGGHTIRDVSISCAASPCGIFAEVQQGASILDLNVIGDYAPSGNADSIGGIAGVNNGLIAGCSFSGSISGNAFVGGIVGENFAYGCIQSCRSEGNILGSNMTGGIAGRNAGTIQDCRSESFVNIVSTDPQLNLNDLDIAGILKSFTVASSDVIGVVQDSGGIAGYNSGIIGVCENQTTVGYQHIGYNVGGIAGRSCGHIYACQNNGEVYGRKDIGGIVGQMEPYINLLSQSDMLGNLAGQYSGLTFYLNEASEDAVEIGDTAAERYHAMSDRVQSLVNELYGVDITNPDSIQDAVNAISDSLSSFSGSLSGFGNDIINAGNILSEDMQDINGQIGGIAGATTNMLRAITNPANLQIIHDASAEDIDAVIYGKIEQCENKANIYGDINIGGIIGQMSVENEMNPEDDLEISLGGTVRSEFEYKAVLLNCQNNGSITARKNCVGSICGFSNLGVLVQCEGYGTIISESGNYVGGIAGSNWAKIISCWSKCTLSGGRFVGGIQGNGYDDADNSSSVSDCVALVRIQECGQFCGAISGYSAGFYEGNYFVSDELQGINGLSLAGKAEPIPFEALLSLDNLPEAFRTFTLSFQVGDTVIKKIPVHYGDRLDANLFPEIPEKEGYIASWENISLEELHTDYILHAVYKLYDTILPSNLVRTNGRPALYVEGRFAEGSRFEAEQTPEEHCVSESEYVQPIAHQLGNLIVQLLRGDGLETTVRNGILEQLTLHIPEDGQQVHTVRYILPNQFTGSGCAVYLRDKNGLTKLDVVPIGSYVCFPVAGSTAEIVIFSASPTVWMFLIFIAASVLACVLLVLLIRIVRRHPSRKAVSWAYAKIRKTRSKYSRGKRVTIFLSVFVSLMFLILAGLLLRDSPLGQQLRAVREVKTLLSDTAAVYDLHISGNWGARRLDDIYTLSAKQVRGERVSCMSVGEISVYYCGNRVYLPDGTAYEVDATLPDRTELLETTSGLFRKSSIQTQIACGDTIYRISVLPEDARTVLLCLMPEATNLDPVEKGEKMTMELQTRDNQLQKLTCHYVGETPTGAEISLVVTVTPGDGIPEIPDDVLAAISEETDPTGNLTSDLLILAAAWVKFETTEQQSGVAHLSADCGSLRMNDQLDYHRWIVDNMPICRLQKNNLCVYLSRSGICTEDGNSITGGEKELIAISDLLELAKKLSQTCRFAYTADNSGANYTISLTPEASQSFIEKIVSNNTLLNIDSLGGTLMITVSDGRIFSVQVDCYGETKIVLSKAEARFHADLFLDREPQTNADIPETVKSALIIPVA